MTEDLNDYRSKIESKDAAIKELKMELEGCHSLIMQLKVQYEEVSLMLSVCKTGSTEAQSKLNYEKAEMDLQDKEREENVSFLMEQLESKNTALVKAQADIEEERDKVASLLRRVESFNLIEQQQLLMQKEIERHKEMFVESSECQVRLKEQALQMEGEFKERLREVCDALDRANSNLAEKICEVSEIEFELQMWKSIAERLKVDLEENHEMRREIEASLLAQVEVEETLKQEKDGLILMLEEKERRIDNLQQQIVLLDRELKVTETETASFARTDATLAFQSEKHSCLQIAKEDRIVESLQKEIEWMEQESIRRELEGAMLAQIGAESTFEHEKENLIQLVHDKDRRIDDLLQLLKSLEQKFNSSLVSFSLQIEEKQVEINLVHEAWEKITTAEILAELEIEEKKLMIVELEDDICNIQQKLEYKEKSSSQSKRQAMEIEAELEAKKLEMKRLTHQMETKLKTSDALINKLKSEKMNLLEDVSKLSSERENLLGFIGGMCDRIRNLSTEDMQLEGILGRIVQTSDNNQLGMDLKGDDEFESMKENTNTPLSPMMKNVEVIPDERSPFRELNS
ncbi:hypothetical protein L1049_023658 [Liquidambar formosana]|uniref:Uncharacterized protein n=1 Tax=Liquidambar formosana TaxID=63359 RepID=A0AAP0X471_LIQFO